MVLKNQVEAMTALKSFAENKAHALLIVGAEGCGKSYLAKEYAKMLDIEDFIIVQPKVDILRNMMSNTITQTTNHVVCIENLDQGLSGASYSILKYLEEPRANVYIVITCRNINQIPDTIVSRAVTLSVPGMVDADLLTYIEKQDPAIVARIKSDNTLLKCIKSFNDVSTIAQLSDSNAEYFHTIPGLINMKDSVSTISWRLQKFKDGTETPIILVLRYMMNSNPQWRTGCIKALDTIALNRFSINAVLSNLIMDLKYKVVM